MRDELTIQDGVIFRGQRIVVPVSLRGDMKQKLHASHLGVESCLRRARETIYWPGMNAEVKELNASCETFRKYEASNQKETLMPHEVPSHTYVYLLFLSATAHSLMSSYRSVRRTERNVRTVNAQGDPTLIRCKPGELN